MANTNDALTAATRDHTGTTSSTALRHAGKIPAILFGHGAPPLPLALEARALSDLLNDGAKNRLLKLSIDGKPGDTALIREIQRDPLTRRVIHVDLQRVLASETISTTLPIVPVGTAEGVRTHSGVMDVVVHALQVRGPADALPEKIEIDVTGLNVFQHITAADVTLPPNIELDVDPHTVLISIEPLRAEIVEEPAAAAAGEVPTVAETEATEG